MCTGNISRSFLAETILTHEIERRRLHNISLSSAGLFAYPGNPPDPKMVAHLSEMGIPIKRHDARQMTRQDVAWADQIMVMENEHALMIRRLWPEAADKVELLGNYISQGQDPVDIVDPFGRSPYHYRLAQSQITLAVRSLVKRLASGNKKNHHAQDQIHRS